MMNIKKWFRIKIAGLVTILDILEYANTHRNSGLCWSFSNACVYYNVSTQEFLSKCNEFNHDTATKFGGVKCPWWWAPDVWNTGREEYLQYLIDYYKNQKPIYLKRLK